MAVFQAYIDESIGPGGNFVLAGHVAPAEAWAAFSAEWEEMLPYGLRDEDGYYFHMAEMASLPERMERVAAFYRIIERHVLFSMSIHFKLDDFKRAKERIFVPGLGKPRWDTAEVANPQYFAFRAMLDMFHSRRSEFGTGIGLDERVDFIFDEHSQKRALLDVWVGYMASRPPSPKSLWQDAYFWG